MKPKLLISLIAAALGTSSCLWFERGRGRSMEDSRHRGLRAWAGGVLCLAGRLVKATDEDGYVLIEEFSEDSSYRTSEKYSYANADDPLATYAAASGGSRLAQILEEERAAMRVLSDGYLLSINFGRYLDATEQANNRAEEKIDERPPRQRLRGK